MTGQILALSGGVGGAKLVWGLARVVAPERLAVVCNTGDDFVHLGLPICPDLDTVLYTLAGCADPERGWGVAGESWRVLERLGALGGPTWFRLGDLDLATHLRRAELLASGATLSEATAALARALGVAVAVLPMSDDPVATLVDTDEGTLPFQHYFVARRCEPRVGGFRFAGIDAARPQPRFLALLEDPTLAAVILCPSNPFVSLDPILALPGVRARLAACPAPVVAVSPIVGGRALKGPAAKMLAELGLPVDCVAVARRYADFLDGFVLDRADAHRAEEVSRLGLTPLVAPTVMAGPADREALARKCLALAAELRQC